MRIAFYAPLKPPTHPVPSGDRRMGRLLMAALEAGGHQVSLASDFRSFDGGGDPARQARLRDAGEDVASDLITAYRAAPAGSRPHAWVTYHVYHKAPDWLGPAVATALAIPYVIAEASHAPKRAGGPWDVGHQAAARAIIRAEAVLCLTRLDRACVAALVRDAARLSHLPPFLDAAPFRAAAAQRATTRAALAGELGLDPARRWLLAVGMMRAGDKLRSYRALAQSLCGLEDAAWHLLVVGDGPERGAVEAAFAPLSGDRVRFAGALAVEALPAVYAAADICVWPALGEAYGMALLEAQAAGLPVVAGRVRGVPDVVRENVTALLATPGDVADFAGHVRTLLNNDMLRRRLGDAARAFIAGERTIEATAHVLDQVLARARASAAGPTQVSAAS